MEFVYVVRIRTNKGEEIHVCETEEVAKRTAHEYVRNNLEWVETTWGYQEGYADNMTNEELLERWSEVTNHSEEIKIEIQTFNS